MSDFSKTADRTEKKVVNAKGQLEGRIKKVEIEYGEQLNQKNTDLSKLKE